MAYAQGTEMLWVYRTTAEQSTSIALENALVLLFNCNNLRVVLINFMSTRASNDLLVSLQRLAKLASCCISTCVLYQPINFPNFFLKQLGAFNPLHQVISQPQHGNRLQIANPARERLLNRGFPSQPLPHKLYLLSDDLNMSS